MKKCCILISALVLSASMWGTQIVVEPGNNQLTSIIASASAGDTLVFKTGDYKEENTRTVDKQLTFMAAAGAKPTFQTAKIYINAPFEANGIEFYGFNSDYMFRTNADIAGIVTLKNCTLRDNSSRFFYHSSGKSLTSLVIDNCIFKNNQQDEDGVVYICGTLGSFSMTNSTVYNITGIYAVRVKNATSVMIDHCTFYNNGKRPIYVDETSGVTTCAISNCVISNPTATSEYCINTYSGTVDHCVYFNTSGPRTGPTQTDIVNANPQFADAANGDFNFAYTSPLFLSATDGKHIGDVRWGATASTGHAVPGTPLDKNDVVLTGPKIKLTADGIAWNDNEYVEQDYASWTIDVTKSGTYNVVLNVSANSTSTHNFSVSVYNANSKLVTLAETAETSATGAFNLGTVTFAAPGKYLVRLNNAKQWSSATAESIALTYTGGATADIPSTLPVDDAVVTGEEWSREDGWIKRGDIKSTAGSVTWNANATKAGEYNVSMTISSDNSLSLYVTVYDSNNQSVGQVSATSQGTDKALGSITLPKTGIYRMVVTNTTEWSHSWIKDLKFAFVPPVPTASFATTSKDIHVGDEYTQTVTTESDGTVTYSTSSPAIATIDATTGKVTGVAIGTTTITATIAATDNFKSTTATYSISVVATPTTGRKYYIDPGTDQLYNVIQNAQENDTVVFRDGTYTEAHSRTFATMITLMADEGAHPKINTVSYLKATKGITIDGIDVNSTHGDYAIYLTGDNSDDMIFKNASITCTGDYAIKATAAVNRIIIDNCILSAKYIVGIRPEAVNTNLVKMTNSTLIDCAKYAFYLPNVNTAATIVVDHCTFYNIEQYAVDGYGFNSSNSTYSNCVIYNPSTKGTYGILAGSYGDNATVTNCLINNFTTATYHTTNTNLLTDDPLLVVTEDGYFYQSGSPIIGAATDGSNLGDPRWKMQSASITISDLATDNSVLVANLNKTVDVQLERSLAGGMYNTICLPFDLSAEQLAASDWAGAKIIALSSTTLEDGKLYLNYEEAEAIEAGKGYLIQPLTDVADPSFEDVTITKTEATVETIDDVEVRPTLIISQIEASPTNLYLYQNNTLYYPNNQLQIDGLRLYYHVNSSAQIPARMRIIGRGTTTELGEIEQMDTVRKYILDGRLYIIRNGVEYNAQGQIVK